MSRINTRILLFSLLLLTWGGGNSFATENPSSAIVDLVESMQSYYLGIKEAGNIQNLPDSITKGNIFDQAFSVVEKNTIQSSLMAIEGMFDYLSNRCNQEITMTQISTVFAETQPGNMYQARLESRQGGETLDIRPFEDACIAVYTCYHAPDQQKNPQNTKSIAYTTDAIKQCTKIIEDLYHVLEPRARAQLTLNSTNYGDELLSNANMQDGPYDLLGNAELLGDLFFAHNDPASEIHFYDMQPLENYVDNDPLELTPDKPDLKPWDNKVIDRRLPPANTSSPVMPTPDEMNKDPNGQPGSQTPEGIGAFDPNTSPTAITVPHAGAPATNTLQNNICYISIDADPKPKNILELGLQEQKQTATYNDALNLEDRVAVALLGKMSAELEEKYGLDDVVRPIPPAQQKNLEEAIAAIDIKGEDTKAIADAFEQCIQENTENQDKNAFKKIIWKSITQPTTLSACAKKAMCKRIGDTSGKGMYGFEFCKVPVRGYAVNAHQPVNSIEEIVDEVSNICTSLKESGQLIEHNKTKDSRDHQLMRVDFSEKLSFGLSIGFKSVTDKEDPAAYQRKQVERNSFLERTLLDIGGPATALAERNKYVMLRNSVAEQSSQQPDDQDVADQKIRDFQSQLPVATQAKDKQVQLTQRATMLDEWQTFVEGNTNFWRGTNDYTHSLNQKWQSTYERFKNDPGT